MKTKFLFFLSFLALNVAAQRNLSSTIKIEGKPVDVRKEFVFVISKHSDDVTISYKSIDSISKLIYDNNDLNTINRLLKKSEVYFDSLSNDSLLYLQKKLDEIRHKSTYFKLDSTTVYKSSHPVYWKLLETILGTPNEELTKKRSVATDKDGTYCFFTLTQNNSERQVHIEEVNTNVYPLLSKLVNESFAIIQAHQIVMKKKNN